MKNTDYSVIIIKLKYFSCNFQFIKKQNASSQTCLPNLSYTPYVSHMCSSTPPSSSSAPSSNSSFVARWNRWIWSQQRTTTPAKTSSKCLFTYPLGICGRTTSSTTPPPPASTICSKQARKSRLFMTTHGFG